MIRHVGIVVWDIKKAMKFYSQFGFVFEWKHHVTKKRTHEVFGSNAKEDNLSGFTWVKLKHPKCKTMIELYKFDSNLIGLGGLNTYNHIAITVKKLDEIYNKLKKDYPECLISEINENKRVKMLMIRDNDTNLLELVEEK